MGIPQFGMIIRLSQHHLFYKLELLVVLSITIFMDSCSHFHFLNVLWGVVQSSYLYFSNSSSAFNVVLHVGSWRIYEVSASHFCLIDLLSFLDGFQSWII
jgi:hypothetical protein